jgi:hypothetical protein
MRIAPCHGCPVGKGCERREELRAKVRGIGARSVTFRCDKLDAELRPGRRIMISTPRMWDRGNRHETDFRVEGVAVPATIVASHDGEFSCVIDRGHVHGGLGADGEPEPPKDRYRFRRLMRASRIIRFLDEPNREVCKQGRVLLPDRTCDRPEDETCYCAAHAAPAS